MKQIIFATTNAEKTANAKLICSEYGIKIIQQPININEIQSDKSEEIILDKLYKSYEEIKKPIIVTDDCWNIPGLNGFPGPYMKYINLWLTTNDYINLTKTLSNREIWLIQTLAYYDGKMTKLFSSKTIGEILKEPHGIYGAANHKLVSLEQDHSKTIAEIYDQGLNNSNRKACDIWHTFSKWYNQDYSSNSKNII